MQVRIRTLVLFLAGTLAGSPARGQVDTALKYPALQDGLLLKLNLPSLTLELFQGTELVRRYPVAIGDSAHPTPQGIFEVTHVDWDPWWVPPASEWAKQDKVTPPGPLNPMGRVRLSFRELYFIHGTPDGRSVGTAASHGCVRLYNADAIDLAKRVLRYGAPEMSAAEIDQLAAKRGKTRTIRLERTVPVEIRYDIAAVAGRTLTIYPDVYRRAAAGAIADSVLSALERVGVVRETVDPARIRRLLESGCRERMVIDLDSLAARH